MVTTDTKMTMISRLPPPAPVDAGHGAFLDALAQAGFAGEIARDHANRTVLATDNSIYSRAPQAVLYPRDTADLDRIAHLAGTERFAGIVLAPRGGGTGTNGQSLTEGLVVDVSRHMNRILEIDEGNRRVRVQPGVVKDQLNAALRPFGLFFAPELSTSNRATLGGMISTDASGQGSCEYGKTRDHVLALEMVLLGGDRLVTRPLDEAELDAECRRGDRVGEVYRAVCDICDGQRDLIAERFPDLNRCLTGYDLAHLRRPDGRFDLGSVICGSEGTLGFLSEAELVAEASTWELMLAPIFVSSGVNTKLLLGMELGLPLVATRAAAAPLGVWDESGGAFSPSGSEPFSRSTTSPTARRPERAAGLPL